MRRVKFMVGPDERGRTLRGVGLISVRNYASAVTKMHAGHGAGGDDQDPVRYEPTHGRPPLGVYAVQCRRMPAFGHPRLVRIPAAASPVQATPSARRVEQVGLPGQAHQLGSLTDAELLIDVGSVGLDGADRHEELVGDLRVGETKGDEPQHFDLAIR